MRGFRPAALVAAIIAITSLPSPGAAPVWKRLDTPNFTVIGSAGERDLRSVAAQFERFREVLTHLLPSRTTATIVPTVVIVFDSTRAFDPFKPLFRGKRMDVAGLFLPAHDVNYIAVVGGSREMHTIFHEYAHLVTSNVTRALPVWLNEGLAEYYSTFELFQDGRQAHIGRPIASHLERLREQWIPLAELLAVAHDSPLYNESDRRSAFYAESWALVHYLLHGKPSRRELLAKYINALDTGAPAAETWSRIVGSEPIESGLRDYVRRMVFQAMVFTLAEKVVVPAPAASPLSESDVDAFLGDFLLRQRRIDEAAVRLEPAAARADGARARAVVARLRLSQNRPAEARTLLARAEPARDWLIDYAVGVAAAELLAADPQAGEAPEIRTGRQASERAAAARPDVAHASYVLASLALKGEPDLEVAHDAADRARYLAPSRPEYTFRLAEVLVQQREYEKARNALGPLMANPRAEGVREPVRSMLAYIATLERAAAGARDAAPPPEPSMPAIVLDLRKSRPGEERAAGMLFRIDCGRDGVTFHVRSDGVATQYRAARFPDVEFISYRDDLRGNVACGVRDPEDLVYVTWRPDAPQAAGAAPAKTIVAVEFLPKDYQPKP